MARVILLALLVVACVPQASRTESPAEAFEEDAGSSPTVGMEHADASGAIDVVTAEDAAVDADADADPGLTDSGGSVPDAGLSAPPPELSCDGATMRDAGGTEVAIYESAAVCEEVLAARGDGVVCAYFELGDRIGPGAWDETGWRAMNWRTRTGLGRRPHESYQNCLDATRNARGGVVCTNTGVGYKSAHVETNQWCGASSAFSYCLMASVAARDFWVCSFPSDGDGSGPGWNLTHIVGSSCEYTVGGLDLADCNGMIP